MSVHDSAPQYNKTSVGGVQMSGLMKVRTNSKNAAAQIHGAGPTTKSYSGPGSADNASFDKKREQKDVSKSLMGFSDSRTNIIKPSNQSNSKSVGA